MSISEFNKLTLSGTIKFKDSEGETRYGSILLPSGTSLGTTTPYNEVQLPFKYQIYRERARLVPCCFWRNMEEGDSEFDLHPYFPNKALPILPETFEFINHKVPDGTLPQIEVSVSGQTQMIDDPDTDVVGGWAHEIAPSFYIVPRTFEVRVLSSGTPELPTKCTHPDANLWSQGRDSTPPCNGAKSECPFYTGPLFRWIGDVHMAAGQPILGQGLQELRSLLYPDWDLDHLTQEEWEESFEIPHIWGRDPDDSLAESYIDEVGNEILYTMLTRVYWDVETKEPQLNKYPGALAGTPNEGSDKRTPPNFPTLITELGTIEAPLIKISFPPQEEFDNKLNVRCFTYRQMYKTVNQALYNPNEILDPGRLYICGTAYSLTNVYIINTTLIPEFPRQFDVNDPETKVKLSSLLKKYYIHAQTIGNVEGFKFIQADRSRFWELEGGIELKENCYNHIVALLQVDGQFAFDVITVKYYFYTVEICQSFEQANMQPPRTRNLITRLSNLSYNEGMQFKLVDLTERPDDPNALDLYQVKCIDAIHFHTHRKEYARMVANDPEAEELKDLRFWAIARFPSDPLVCLCSKGAYPPGTLEAPGKCWSVQRGIFGNQSQDIWWKRLDNCLRLLIRLPSSFADVGKICPALNRYWYIKEDEMWFIARYDADETGRPTDEPKEEKVRLKIVDWRSEGIAMPANYLVVETEKPLRFPPKQESEVAFLWALLGFSSKDPICGDTYKIFREYFAKDDLNSLEVFNEEAENFDNQDDKFIVSPHEFTVGQHTIEVTGNNVYDNNYIFVIAVEEAEGKTIAIGNKWSYGVREIVDTWSRDVDITFKQVSPQQSAILPCQQDRRVTLRGSGFVFTAESGDFGRGKIAVYHSQCGDHENSFYKFGPLFHPYNDCDEPKVEIRNPPIYVKYNIQTDLPNFERDRAPDLYYPFVWRYNALSLLDPDCTFEFTLGNEIRGAARWAGMNRMRGPISQQFLPMRYLFYKSLGWTFPVFGNIGREQIRCFKTVHYREYVYVDELGKLKTSNGWLPILSYQPSPSLYDRHYPRCMLSSTFHEVNSLTLGDEDAINLPSGISLYEFIMKLLNKAVENMVIDPQESPEGEMLYLTRMKFDGVFKVVRLLRPDGSGVRYPKKGYFFNLIPPPLEGGEGSNVAAIQNLGLQSVICEPYLELGRKEDKLLEEPKDNREIFSGVRLSKPRTKTGNYARAIDRFKRDISLSVADGKYIMSVQNPVYKEGGVLEEYAKLNFKYSDEFESEDRLVDWETNNNSVYFDRFSGEIKQTVGEDPESDATEYSDIKRDSFTPEEFYFVRLIDEDVETLEGEDAGEVLETNANVFGKSYFYFSNTSDPIHSEDLDLMRFRTGLCVEEIIPKFMPKKELLVDTSKIEWQFLNPSPKFSRYPSVWSGTRAIFDGQYLPETEYKILRKEDDFNTYSNVWEPLTLEEELVVTASGEPEQCGYLGEVALKIRFDYPVELSELDFRYQVAGKLQEDRESLGLPEDIEVISDPYIKVVLHNTSEATLFDREASLLLLEKPELSLKEYFGLSSPFPYTSFVRGVKVSLEGKETSYIGPNTRYSNIILDHPVVVTEIEVVIGPRKPYHRFMLSNFLIRGMVFDEDMKEEFVVNNPRYLPIVGYTNQASSSKTELYQYLFSGQFLSGLASGPDVSDPLEAAGIALFWRAPLLLPEDGEPTECRTRGKYLRHWAGLFNTWDTQGVYNSGGVRNADVFNTEEPKLSWQKDLVDSMVEKLELLNCGSKQELSSAGVEFGGAYKNLLLLTDAFFIGLGGNIKNLLEDKIPEKTICKTTQYNSDNFMLAVVPFEQTRFGGFRACVDYDQLTRGNCLNTDPYWQSRRFWIFDHQQGVCNAESPSLIEGLPVLSFPSDVELSTSVTDQGASAGTQGGGYEETAQEIYEDVASEAQWSKDREQRRKDNDPSYNP